LSFWRKFSKVILSSNEICSQQQCIKLNIEPGSFEDTKENVKNKECESNKGETEYLTTSESRKETGMGAFAALEASSSVGINSNSHTNVTSED
jgi:hypothetical protein